LLGRRLVGFGGMETRVVVSRGYEDVSRRVLVIAWTTEGTRPSLNREVTREKANVQRPDLTHAVTSQHAMPSSRASSAPTPCTRQPDSDDRQHPYIFQTNFKRLFSPSSLLFLLGRTVAEQRPSRSLSRSKETHITTRIKHARPNRLPNSA
jgi:hypothetical protein